MSHLCWIYMSHDHMKLHPSFMVVGKEMGTQKELNDSFNQGLVYSHSNYTNGWFSKPLLRCSASCLCAFLFMSSFAVFCNILYTEIFLRWLLYAAWCKGFSTFQFLVYKCNVLSPWSSFFLISLTSKVWQAWKFFGWLC